MAIILPILGIVLSAWLLPAITRQWDDRQKEQELKAALIRDVASATAHAFVAGDGIWPRGGAARLTRLQRLHVGDQWAFANLDIDARLRTYFPDDVAADWRVFGWAVDRFITARRISAATFLGDVVSGEAHLDPPVADATALLLVSAKHFVGGGPRFTGDSPVEQFQVAELEKLLRRRMARYEREAGGLYTWRVIEKQLLGLEQAVVEQITVAHAAGYSTTGGDLIRDLIP